MQSLTLMERQVNAQYGQDDLWLDRQAHLSLQGHAATLKVSPDCSQEVFMLAFSEVHRAAGWLPLHAAVVACGGRAVAISGYSGAGKSTSVLRLAGLGYQVVAEDRAFWHPASGQIAGLDRHLRAFQDSVQRFAPHLWSPAEGGPRDGKGKYLLPLVSAAKPAQLEALVLLGEGHSNSAAELVRAAWECTGVPLTASARQQMQRGVERLLPLMQAQGVTRQSVLSVVEQLLTRREADK